MRRVTFLIEDELFKKAKIKAIEADMNMTEYITMLIKSDLLSKQKKNKHMPSKARVFVLKCEISEMHLISMCIVTCFHKKVKF